MVCHFQWCCMESLLHSDLDKCRGLRMDTLFSSEPLSHLVDGFLWFPLRTEWVSVTGHNWLVVKRGEQLQVLVDLASLSGIPFGLLRSSVC